MPSSAAISSASRLRLFRQTFEAQGDDGGALAPPGPGRHHAAAANEIAELRHDALRPRRRRVEAREIGGPVENLGRLQFVENEEALDVGRDSAEHAIGEESLGGHPLRGVLTRQPVTIVGQIGPLDIAPDRQKTRSAHRLYPPPSRSILMSFRPQAVQRRRNLLVRQLCPSFLHGGQDRGDVSVGAETADHGGGSARRDRMPVQFVPRVNVRDVNLDLRSFEDLQRVDQRDRRERIGGGVHDDRVGIAVRRLDQVDEFTFEIGLVKRDGDAEIAGQFLAARLDFPKRRRAIDVGLPDPQEIQVRSVQDHDLRGHCRPLRSCTEFKSPSRRTIWPAPSPAAGTTPSGTAPRVARS